MCIQPQTVSMGTSLKISFVSVLPIIMPFDGQNSNSVVVMDNASIHYLERIHDIITGVGARLCFLPPYSPDLMPLEEAFSKVKYFLKVGYLATSQPHTLLKWHLPRLRKMTV